MYIQYLHAQRLAQKSAKPGSIPITGQAYVSCIQEDYNFMDMVHSMHSIRKHVVDVLQVSQVSPLDFLIGFPKVTNMKHYFS